MFDFLKNKLSKIYSSFSSKLFALFGKKTIDKETLLELETLLITSDMGIKTTKLIIQQLNDKFASGQISKGADLREFLEKSLVKVLNFNQNDISNVILLTGINGSGKTTFAAKLANFFNQNSKRVLLVAGDTFRAAATNQLAEWANKTNTSIEIGKNNQDPASVIFAGCERFKKENYDVLIIDTAGRLQTKVNLMKELEKIKKVIQRQLPDNKITTLLTIDAMLGQNSFEQAKIFNESTQVDGLVLTKMDGTGKAGVAFAIVQELKIPIAYVCFGEELNKLKKFDAQEYVQQLLSENN